MNINARVRDDRSEEGRNGLTEETEIECHACGRMIGTKIDLTLNGNHVIVCPCGHEHCRVVKNGRITSARWDQRNRQQTYQYTAVFVYVGTSATSVSYGSSSGTWVTLS